MKRISRRTALRGAIAGGSVAVGLPLLEAMMPRQAKAAGETAPKRLVVVFTANGNLPEIWTPNGGDNIDLAGHPLHASLEPLQEKLIFLDNVNQQVAYDSIGDGHQTGMACLLTNAEILPGSLFCEGNCEPGSEVYVGWGGGQSIDQFVAQEIAKDTTTKFRSLELGVQVKNASVWTRMSYAGPDQPIPHREDPNQNFTDLFGDLEADPFELALLKRKRKSVLDAVMSDYTTFNKRLGSNDKERLEAHLTAIREFELRLDAIGTFGQDCGVPAVDLPGANYQQNDNYPLTGRAQMDLLVMALACDMTRVGSLQWSASVSGVNMSSWLPLIQNRGHHDMSHDIDTNPDTYTDLTTVNRWYSDQFFYLINAMNSVQEGDGTLLDNSVVLWVNELGKGNSHTRNDIPFMIAGGGQGYFKTGRAIDMAGAPHGQLLVSVAHAMGYPIQSFGVPQYSQGPLPGLKA